MLLGQRIRLIRGDRPLSEISDQSGVSKAYLSRIETDVAANPTIQQLMRIAKALNVSLEDLFRGTSDKDWRKDEELPESLKDCIDTFSLRVPELEDPDFIHVFKQIKVQGRSPQGSEDWLALCLLIKRSCGIV